MVNRNLQRAIAYRVQAARAAKKWTQEQLSQALGLNDRQTISDIETGKRALKSDELLKLSELLEQDIDFFINPFSIVGEAQFSWHANPAIAKNTLDAFELKMGLWVGLLRWLRVQQNEKNSVFKQSLRLSAQSSFEDAQECAEKLVVELELGLVPAKNLSHTIQHKLNIPTLLFEFTENKRSATISGATCHLEEMDVILINRHEPETRRYYDLAYALFHVLTWDSLKPEHLESNLDIMPNKKKRLEQLVDNFAAALLMPRASLDRLIDLEKKNDITHLCGVAAQLHVAPVALSWRLLNLNRISLATHNNLRLKKQHLQQFIAPRLFSDSFVKLLHNALENEHLSARKASKIIGLELSQLTELFSQYHMQPSFELEAVT
jgi:transcriptional regulator with XRE-family HTH domain